MNAGSCCGGRGEVKILKQCEYFEVGPLVQPGGPQVVPLRN